MGEAEVGEVHQRGSSSSGLRARRIPRRASRCCAGRPAAYRGRCSGWDGCGARSSWRRRPAASRVRRLSSCQTCTPRAGGCAGIVAQRHGVADESGVDFEERAVQAHGAIALNAALGLEEEQGIQIEAWAGQAHLLGAHGPAIQRRLILEAAMRRLVILALDPGPQTAIEGLEAVGVGRGEAAERAARVRCETSAPSCPCPGAGTAGRG